MSKKVGTLITVLMLISVNLTAYASAKVQFKLGNGPTLVIAIIFGMLSGAAIVISLLSRTEVRGRLMATFFMSLLVIIIILSGGSLSKNDETKLERLEREIDNSEDKIKKLEKKIDKTSNLYEIERLMDDYYEEVDRYNDKVSEYNSILE